MESEVKFAAGSPEREAFASQPPSRMEFSDLPPELVEQIALSHDMHAVVLYKLARSESLTCRAHARAREEGRIRMRAASESRASER